MEQKRFSFDKETLIKIGTGALIASVGALLTYLLQALSNMDYGVYTPIIVAVMSILVNMLKEWQKGAKK